MSIYRIAKNQLKMKEKIWADIIIWNIKYIVFFTKEMFKTFQESNVRQPELLNILDSKL